MAQELKVIADFYDFILWLIRHTEKFARHRRYSLSVAMQNRLQAILSLLALGGRRLVRAQTTESPRS